MTPSNVRIDLQTSSFSTDASPSIQREPWFDVPYLTKPISDDLLEQWSCQAAGPELALPPKNNFIPTDFALRSDDTATASTSQAASEALGRASPARSTRGQGGKETAAPLAGQKHSHNGSLTNGSAPQHSTTADSSKADPVTPPDLLCNVPGLRVWHKLDRHFETPKAAAYFLLTSAAMYDSPRAAAATHLLVKVLEDTLCETAYLADVAGLSYDVRILLTDVSHMSMSCPELYYCYSHEMCGQRCIGKRRGARLLLYQNPS